MSEKTIVVPDMQLQRMVVGIKGVTPLLTNRFSEESLVNIEDKQQKRAKLAKVARDPESEFRAARHEISPGVYGFPGAGIKRALASAGGRFADEQQTRLLGALSILAELIPIDAPEPTMRRDPVILRGMVASIAYRPQYTPWSMNIPVMFNSTIISQDQVLNLFQLAGFAVGIGAWRPEKKGNFGVFQLADMAA